MGRGDHTCVSPVLVWVGFGGGTEGIRQQGGGVGRAAEALGWGRESITTD